MSEKTIPAPVQVTVAGVKASNPAISPTPVSAGVAVVSSGIITGKTAVVHGQVSGTSVIIDNPA